MNRSLIVMFNIIKRFECKPSLISNIINPNSQTYILTIKKIGSEKYNTLGYSKRKDDFEDGLKIIKNYIYRKWKVTVKINCIKYTIGKTDIKKLAKRNQYYKYRKITKNQVLSLNTKYIYQAIYNLINEIDPGRFVNELDCLNTLNPSTCVNLEHLSNLPRASDRNIANNIRNNLCI